MTAEDATPSVNNQSFNMLKPYQYVLLTTLRKTGAGVATPVWFAQQEEKVYIVTPATTGKIKRLRNNGHVTLAPCKYNGQVVGETLEGIARILAEDEQAGADKILARKYGWLYRIYSGFQKLRRVQQAFIEIQTA